MFKPGDEVIGENGVRGIVVTDEVAYKAWPDLAGMDYSDRVWIIDDGEDKPYHHTPKEVRLAPVLRKCAVCNLQAQRDDYLCASCRT